MSIEKSSRKRWNPGRNYNTRKSKEEIRHLGYHIIWWYRVMEKQIEVNLKESFYCMLRKIFGTIEGNYMF